MFINCKRLDESFLLFSRDVVDLLAVATSRNLLAFDGRSTFAVNFAFWSHFLNLTIFDDRQRIDSQQHYLTTYMHTKEGRDEDAQRQNLYARFCDNFIYAHHVRSADVMRETFHSSLIAQQQNACPAITLPRQQEYLFRTDRFPTRLPDCTCRSLSVFLPKAKEGHIESEI
jgi:hypothetical protein